MAHGGAVEKRGGANGGAGGPKWQVLAERAPRAGQPSGAGGQAGQWVGDEQHQDGAQADAREPKQGIQAQNGEGNRGDA